MFRPQGKTSDQRAVAAIDGHDGADHVARARPRQKQHDFRHFVGIGITAQRNARLSLFERLLFADAQTRRIQADRLLDPLGEGEAGFTALMRMP